MAKEPIVPRLTEEIDEPHAIAPSKELRAAFGVKKEAIQRQKVNEIAGLLWHNESVSETEVEVRIIRAIELYEGLEPVDGAEGMLAVQMVGTHDAALECLRRAALSNQTIGGRDMALKHAQKLMTLYTQQLATLNKHRGKGQQKVTVEHVNVGPGGQAILGNVDTVQTEIVSGSPDEDEPKTIDHMADVPVPESQTKSAVARKKR